MKNTSPALTLLLLLPCLVPAAAQAQFTYTTNADGVSATITGYGGLGGDVYIPSEINGLTVTSIGNSAFETMIIPPHYISPSGSMTRVTIPETVTNIGASAFAFCNSLVSVTLTEGIISIGENAFAPCASLTNVIIPRTVTHLGPAVFGDSPNVTKITVEGGDPAYSSVNGVLFDRAQTMLLEFPNGWNGSYVIPGGYAIPGNYTIPDGVTTIAPDAFYFCDNVTNVTIPDSVTNIAEYAFDGCVNLAGVYFAGNAPAAGALAFTLTNTIANYLPGTAGWTDFSANTRLRTVPWNPLIQAGGASLSPRTNSFGFNISTTNAITVVVTACADLSNPFWFPLQTVTITNGQYQFTDPQWTNYSNRFYGLTFP